MFGTIIARVSKKNMIKIYLFAFVLLLCFSTITYAQVGVGTLSPDASSALEIASTSKGVLLPRVNLTSNTMDLDANASTIQPIGMMVYNTGTVLTRGFCYWSGTEWRSIISASLAPGTLGTIQCNAVTINPESYTAGTPYSGTMSVPYTGSNGGVFAAQTIGPINGLTATLTAGNFTVGSGTLLYTLSGTPTVTSPTPTTFPITIGGKTCSAVVGVGSGIAPGDLVYYHTSISASITSGKVGDYVTDLPILGGKLRLDYLISGSSVVAPGTFNVNPILFNVSASNQKIWFACISTVGHFNGANYLLASNSYVRLDDGVYSTYGFNDISTSSGRVGGIGVGDNHEVLTADVLLDDKWYKVYFWMIEDNKNTALTTDDTREIYLSIQRLYSNLFTT